MNEGRLPNPVPRLEEPIRFSGDTSMSGTPDVSADIREHLHITETSSEEDDEGDDTTSDTNSSIESAGLEAKLGGLRLAELPTGICYDERMRYHAEVSASTGENVHPEDPRRIYYIYKELHEAGL
ncbi:MAG: Histone deacetylase hda1, partial [Watsoniomyces obsoletus]